MAPPQSFSCAELKRAIKATNYGTYPAIGARLGVTGNAVEIALRPGRQCADLRREFLDRKKGIRSREVDVTCNRALRALTKHGTDEAAADALGVERTSFYNMFLAGRCQPFNAKRQRIKAEFHKRRTEKPCRRMLKLLKKHRSIWGAAQELGVPYNTVKFSFYGQRAHKTKRWSPGSCARFARQAERALR